jgi:oxalate decarboxylase
MTHKLPLGSITPQVDTPFGRKVAANKEGFPILKGLAIYRLTIRPGCFREPHWHANADELGYCLSGSALVTLFASGNIHAQFTISAGEMFFVPSGSLHAIENSGETDAEFIITFSHEQPEDFGISGFAGCLTPAVLANTWGMHVEELAGRPSSPQDIEFGRLASPSVVPEAAAFVSPFKFSIGTRAPLVANEDGSATVARRDTWPVLRNQAMYSVHIHGIGMREPHWHPETAELGFVKEGRARMTVESPGGRAETYELEPGDAYFIPRAYPHHIENLTDGEVHFLIFFDTPDVQDIGFTGAIPAFPGRVMEPTLGLNDQQLADIPRLPADLLLVGKKNPVEP